MQKHVLPLLLILAIAILSLRSLLVPGFMYSHDSLWHVQRIQNMTSLISEQFPVRWSPGLDNGYGIPLFNFTYPAPYYLGALLMLLGSGPVKAYYALLFLAYFGGGVGVYFLARSRLLGTFAATLYLLTPYQFLDIFVRGALGEVWAMGLFPWILLVLNQVSLTGKIRWYTPLPLFLLLLSHNFFAFLFLGVLALFTLFIYRHKLKIILSFVLSLSLSAFFIIPAFFEKSHLLITHTTSSLSSFQDHFLYPAQLLYSPWSYFGSQPGFPVGEMSFQLGLANIVLSSFAILLTLYLVLSRKTTHRLVLYLLTLALLILMTLPISTWLWQHIPLLSSLQFPWRFVGLTGILFVLIYLEVFQAIKPAQTRFFWIFSLLLISLAFINTRNYLRPVQWLDESEFYALHYEYVGKTTTAHRAELVPVWASLERQLPSNSLVLSSGVELLSQQESDLALEFTATSPDNQGTAIYHRNYYPSWQLSSGGVSLPLTPTSTGEITFVLLAGEHTYELAIGSTPLARLGNFISLISLLLIFGLMLVPAKYLHPKTTSSSHV